MDVSRNKGGEAGVNPLNAVRNLQEDREKKAAEAERRLREMEEERMKLDEELKRHREKARRVNIGQEVLEAKIKVGRSMFFFSFFLKNIIVPVYHPHEFLDLGCQLLNVICSPFNVV